MQQRIAVQRRIDAGRAAAVEPRGRRCNSDRRPPCPSHRGFRRGRDHGSGFRCWRQIFQIDRDGAQHRRRSSCEVELTTTSAIGPSAWLWPLRPLARYSTMSSTLHDFSPLRSAPHRAAARTSPRPGRRQRRGCGGRRRTGFSAYGRRRNARRPRPDSGRDSIPRSFLVGLEDAGPEESEIPRPHDDAVVQRPAQLRWRRLIATGVSVAR